MAATMLTSKEVAEELGTDAKTLRKFLRSDASGIDGVGQGNRYSIPRAKVRQLAKAYKTWTEAHSRANGEGDDATNAA
jgi:hypothetical protein